MSYQPSQKVLEKYADVLINYALNSGAGVKKGEVVQCLVPDVAKPLLQALQNTILKAGAQPLLRLIPTGMDKDYYTLASEEQLKFFPETYLHEQANLIDHQISIIADVDPSELEDVDHRKIFLSRDSKKKYRDWLTEKENQGRFTWTIGLWGTEAKAAEVGLSLEDYWQEIINACFLDLDDPISKWREVGSLQKDLLKKLNDLKIITLKIVGPDVDLTVRLGEDRIWNGGSGRNIPSFELFTSPDWRGTEGWIRFNQPLYRYGNIIQDVRLEFKGGVVVKAEAKRGNKLLQEMLKTENADKIGEFSLTDKRMSRITHVMAETLFDENIGGEFGNTHLAVGMAYKDCFRGDPGKVTKEEWEAMGFNDSAEHTDIISTTDRTVTAILPSGAELVIYQNGEFTL
jgi:aminopeptidase